MAADPSAVAAGFGDARQGGMIYIYIYLYIYLLSLSLYLFIYVYIDIDIDIDRYVYGCGSVCCSRWT